jgi:hypothetical protein
MLVDNPWVGVLSHHSHRHWEVLRRLVLEPSVGEVLAIFRRVRWVRRASGWRPDRATVVAAASSDALSLLYQLVDAAMLTDMLRWALQNVHEGTSMRDIAMAINALETERGYTRAIEEVPLFRDGPQC